MEAQAPHQGRWPGMLWLLVLPLVSSCSSHLSLSCGHAAPCGMGWPGAARPWPLLGSLPHVPRVLFRCHFPKKSSHSDPKLALSACPECLSSWHWIFLKSHSDLSLWLLSPERVSPAKPGAHTPRTGQGHGAAARERSAGPMNES